MLFIDGMVDKVESWTKQIRARTLTCESSDFFVLPLLDQLAVHFFRTSLIYGHREWINHDEKKRIKLCRFERYDKPAPTTVRNPNY
jgi:hypothetical protein